MSEPVYVSRATVHKIEGPRRRAHIAGGAEFEMGVHGSIREHYRLPGPDRPLPVDYLVAAAAG